MNWFTRLLFATRNEPAPVYTEPFMPEPWGGDYRVIIRKGLRATSDGKIVFKVHAIVEHWEPYDLCGNDAIGYQQAVFFQKECTREYLDRTKEEMNAKADEWIDARRNLGKDEVRYVQ